jgi:DNA-directed RNA polymerase alpha subunit
MTNKEIKLELGKIVLARCSSVDLTYSMENIYKWIIEEPEEEITPEPGTEKPDKKDYEQESIQEVYNEMQIIEEEEKLEKKREGYRNVQKKGHAVRFRNAARMCEIETVGQLVKYGKADLTRARNMGEKCVDYVSMALKNLYGIEKW